MKSVMKEPKIALIHKVIRPTRDSLFSQLSSMPLHIYFTAASWKVRNWKIANLSCEYKILPGFSFKFFIKDSFPCFINPSIIWELIKNNDDIILSSGYASFTNQVAFFYAKLRRKPFILWSGSTINEHSFLRKVSLPLIKFIVKHSDAFIAYGTRAKEYLIHLGAPPNRIFIAFNTVDTVFFKQQSAKFKIKREELKNRLGIGNAGVILYVGQLIERKGVKYLLKAYAKLKGSFDVALVIVGDGNQRNELTDFCLRSNIQDVFFAGHKQLEELPQYYAMSDIFVMPSTEEVWGLVLNEAMACGLSVIATDKAGASVDLIKEGQNGYVVEAGNVEQLCEAMKRILSSPELKESMGNKSRQIIDDGFTIEHAKQGFINAIAYITSKAK